MKRCTRLLACWVFLAASGAGAAGASDDAQTRATMGSIVETLSFVLPLSLDEQRFADPARREAILAALTRLAEQGAALEAHGESRDAGFGFLSRSLSDDTREIRSRFAEGRPAEARFLLHRLTEDCIACHSRLPDARTHPIGRRLLEAPEVAALPLEERATLEAAARQFDRALATHEQLLASPDRTPSDLDLSGQLDTYLELCLRVQRDPQRPLAHLTRLAAREDVAPPMGETLQVWIDSLRELQVRQPEASPLAEARALLAAAGDRARFPDDRRALVYYVAASGVLNRFLASGSHSAPELGEAYYLLGLIESRVGRAFWLSQTEALLEASIRVAPGEPSAEQAYTLLDEFVASGYTGSAGGRVPADVRARLGELRALIDSARGT